MAESIFSVSRWLHGLSAVKVHDKTLDSAPQAFTHDLLSCSDLSSNGLSEQTSMDEWTEEATEDSPQVNPERINPSTYQICLPPSYEACLSTIRKELQTVLEVFPTGSPSSVICHALGYALQAKFNWPVKFCCQAKDARLPHTMPVSWAQEVLVVKPLERMACVVDLQFRAKFLARCASPLGEVYYEDAMAGIPEVFVGPLVQLFRDIDTWTGAMEKVFKANSQTLPPWRTRRSFQMLYKFCVECDATPSANCLWHTRRQLGAAADARAGGGAQSCSCRLTPRDLECLGQVVCATPSPQRCGSVPDFSDSMGSDEPLDYAFEKEEAPAGPSASSDYSGLSFLLNSQ